MMRYPREHLETLVAVVDAGTFEAAARRLQVTPGAISQRIKALEQQLGRVVVVRAKPVEVTESGAALVRLARQVALLEHDASEALHLHADAVTVPLAINADTLATWVLPPLARVAERRGVALDLHRDDQEHTASLLAAGTVMAAVTSQSQAVAGCTVTALGSMAYRPVCTPSFAARWFAGGVTADALAVAPLIDFDEKDELQSRYLALVTRRQLSPPRHRVPASADFAQAVRLGLGWGMLPDAQADAARDAGALVDLDRARSIHVPLYWQQWNLRSPLLDAIADAVIAEAVTVLDPPR